MPFKVLYLSLLLVSTFQTITFSQDVQRDQDGFEIFEYQEGDTTYTMKKYFFCMLKQGEDLNNSADETTRIQTEHLAHLEGLANDKKICIAGPLREHDQWSGIVIFNTPTKEEAVELMSKDPAVKAGRLEFEIVDWWAAKGSKLF